MSLFQCEECGCVENTACCDYWWNKAEGLPLVCSACSKEPSDKYQERGKWHGRFERVFLPKGMFRTALNGNLEHIETGDQDYRKYAVPNASFSGERSESAASDS